MVVVGPMAARVSIMVAVPEGLAGVIGGADSAVWRPPSVAARMVVGVVRPLLNAYSPGVSQDSRQVARLRHHQ
jgi:hypothetical protein